MEKRSSGSANRSNKITFLVATHHFEKRTLISECILRKFEDAVIYTAMDHPECLQKLKNVPSTTLILDYTLPKSKPGQTLDALVKDPDFRLIPIIVFGGSHEKSKFIDSIVIGKVQFVDQLENENDFAPFLNRALNYANAMIPASYKIKYLNQGEILIRQGEKAEQVFILKKGKLQAFQSTKENSKIVLGTIQPGEFVGEMAFLNKDGRLATVEAVIDSEVVEIPIDTFDKVIYQRPAWSKVLLETISKRLKKTVQKS